MAGSKDSSGYETFDSLNGIHKGGSTSKPLDDSKSYKGAPAEGDNADASKTAVQIQKGGK